MATHVKKVSDLLLGRYQVFSNHPSVSGTVTFADADLIQVKDSLRGSVARKTKILLAGTVELHLVFNVPVKTTKFQESSVDTTITFETDMALYANLNTIILKNTTGSVEYDFDFPISSVLIEDIVGTIDADNYVQFIFMA